MLAARGIAAAAWSDGLAHADPAALPADIQSNIWSGLFGGAAADAHAQANRGWTVVLSLPALANELILLVKASSLVSVVGIMEITRAAQAQAATTFRPLEVYLAAACVYLAINLCLALLGRWLEHRTAV